VSAVEQKLMLTIEVNFTRNAVKAAPEALKRHEARNMVKMFLAVDQSIADRDIPDYLVSEPMIDRYLAIEPPQFCALTEFHQIIKEIERAYVFGLYFSALSSSVVTIERVLNMSRIALHKDMTPKFKELWNKDAVPDWERNIEALVMWKYLSPELGKELADLYQSVRCHYLHSHPITTMEQDCLRAIKAAYKLLDEILGLPARLFKIGGGITCLEPADPLVRAFYLPHTTPI
jgi:hypothetical protein